jgi:hypothetical protein
MEVHMVRRLALAAHREWEDWMFVGLGALVTVSPVVVFNALPGRMLINIVACGILMLFVSLFEFSRRIPLEEIVHGIVGAWLAVTALFLNYGAATYYRGAIFVLGAAIVLLAGFELWQDYTFRA